MSLLTIIRMFTTLIDCQTLARQLDNPDWVIVDCRFDLLQPQAGRAAYAAGHLPGAVYADLNEDLSGSVTPSSGRHPLPDPQSLAARLGEWGVGPHSQVVAYDAGNSAFAVRLWWLLRWLGHQAVAVLDGGLAAWQAAGLPTSRDAPTPRPARFQSRPQPDMVLGMAQVRDALHERAIILLDARAAPRYAGEVEPIDPVAGHVPGALNLPFEGNLDASGFFLAPAQLRQRFAAFANDPARVAHMCGSGVTACHNLLAMEMAGLHNSRLYVGSWSEWVSDPVNAVTKGYEA